MGNASNADIRAPTAGATNGPEFLLLDGDTQEDLHLFGTDADSPSLFKLCNVCLTEGGARVLKQRMLSPWATPERIRSTQQSLELILKRREAFSELPSAFLALSVDRYTREPMPMVKEHNFLAFGAAAFSMWANEDRFYVRISRGVQFTCRLLKALRAFIRQVQPESAEGEIAPLLGEMQALLNLPRIARIPDDESSGWFWATLRLDQDFRWHEKVALRRLLELIYEIDALLAMADVTRHHEFVMPRIEEGPVRMEGEGLWHPFVPDAIGNRVELTQDLRVLFLTGPNMAGKTTYLRAVATSLYLAHLGMGVPAESFAFVPIERLITSISMSDDLNSGVSYFRAEALRMRAVSQAIADGYRVVAIMDEPFKGTNVKDALDASLAILERLATKVDCLFMVASHLIELSELLAPDLHIDYRYFEAEEQEDRLRFDFILHAGVSSQRLGMRVLREEGIFDLLDN